MVRDRSRRPSGRRSPSARSAGAAAGGRDRSATPGTARASTRSRPPAAGTPPRSRARRTESAAVVHVEVGPAASPRRGGGSISTALVRPSARRLAAQQLRRPPGSDGRSADHLVHRRGPREDVDRRRHAARRSRRRAHRPTRATATQSRSTTGLRGRPADAGVEDRRQHPDLGPEHVVHGLRRDAGRPGDLLDRRRHVAPLEEEALGGLDDLRAGCAVRSLPAAVRL